MLTDHKTFVLLNVYFPNSQKVVARVYIDCHLSYVKGEDRLDYKLKFSNALFKYCDELREKGRFSVNISTYDSPIA